MKVKAIIKTNCSKCEWAKNQLKHYPVEWFNFDTDEEARELAKKHNISTTPTFLMFQDENIIVITRSVLSVKKFVENRNV